jgi:hypothetical protein
MLGPDHPVNLAAAAALTLALVLVGEVEPARALGEDTLRRCRRVFRPDHPITMYLTEAAGIGHSSLQADAAADGPDRPL